MMRYLSTEMESLSFQNDRARSQTTQLKRKEKNGLAITVPGPVSHAYSTRLRSAGHGPLDRFQCIEGIFYNPKFREQFPPPACSSEEYDPSGCFINATAFGVESSSVAPTSSSYHGAPPSSSPAVPPAPLPSARPSSPLPPLRLSLGSPRPSPLLRSRRLPLCSPGRPLYSSRLLLRPRRLPLCSRRTHRLPSPHGPHPLRWLPPSNVLLLCWKTADANKYADCQVFKTSLGCEGLRERSR